MMVHGVLSNNVSEQYEATQKFRKLLSIERNPPIEEVIKTGVVPKFVEFLSRTDAPQLQARLTINQSVYEMVKGSYYYHPLHDMHVITV